TAIAAQDPDLRVIAPVRHWNLRTVEDKLNYARRRRLAIEEPKGRHLTIDRNLWGASIYLDDLRDAWEAPPEDVFTLTRAPEKAPHGPPGPRDARSKPGAAAAQGIAQPSLRRTGVHGLLVPGPAPLPAGLLRADAAPRDGRGSPETLQGRLQCAGPAQRIQPV